MQLLQPDKESCRSEILHARVYGLDLSKGIARAEIFFVGLKKIAPEPMVVEHWWLTLLAVIHKTFQNFDHATFINLYKSYIRPVLEYGNIIWGQQYILDQEQIEKIQRRATKLVQDLQNCTYNDRLTALNLKSFKYRRLRGDMIMFYQLLHSHFSLDTSDLFITATSSTTRGHNYKLFKPQAASRVRSTFFTARAINDWKSLPNHIVNAPTLNGFKNFSRQWLVYFIV